MEPVTDNSSSVNGTPVAAHAEAGRVVLADFKLKLSYMSKAEEEEYDRHKKAIADIIARRDKLTAAISALREFYALTDSVPALEASTPPVADPVKANNHVEVPTVIDNNDVNKQDETNEKGKNDDYDPAGYNFARGELTNAFIDIIREADTFLVTDDILNAVRDRYPAMRFDKAVKKRITDSLKHIRDRGKEVVGAQLYRGKFSMFLHGLSDFYSDVDQQILEPEYQEKFEQRINELNFTYEPETSKPNDDNSVETAPSMASDDIIDEEVAHSQALLRRPKAELDLF